MKTIIPLRSKEKWFTSQQMTQLLIHGAKIAYDIFLIFILVHVNIIFNG